MDDAWFRRQVGRHTNTWRDQPREFARRTAADGALALGALAGLVLLLVIAALVVLIGWWRASTGWPWLVVGLFVAALAWPLVRALRVRAAPPPGVVIGPQQAKEVHALVEKARSMLHAAPVDELRFDVSLEVKLVPQPRLGLLGWPRHVLVIGLPLMMALGTEPLAALVMHALVPLRRESGLRDALKEPTAWIERQRLTWAALAAGWTPSRLLPWWQDAVLAPFMDRFWPRFATRAVVLGREEAMVADRLVLSRCGAQAMATALLGPAVQQQFLAEVFWPQRWASARESHLPNVLPLRELRALIGASLRHPQAKGWLHDALQALPPRGDLRPALRDRLALTGDAARLSKRASEGRSAADSLLGRQLDSWIDLLDAHWQREAAAEWAEVHQAHREREKLLTELAESHASRPVSLDDHLLWIRTASQVSGPAAAVPIAREAVERHPKSPGARYLLACTLLDARGLLPSRHLLPDLPPDANEALEILRTLSDAGGSDDTRGGATDTNDLTWALPAARRLERALIQREGIEALRAVRMRIAELERDADKAMAVLTDFSGPQVLGPARLGGRTLRPLLERLKREPAIGRAWLLAKTDTRARGWVLHLLVVERSNSLEQPGPRHDWADLRALLDPPFPCFVIDLLHPDWTGPKHMDVVQQIFDTAGGRIHASRST
ncbi:hypothetical protein [Ideonella sp.]|uniref:hypothetical protein n=1 Tax=Ideonella sp. TaxID=1929293 RepID=UPI002B49F551|nr:hypothetical protein [Ideonella sp.]HJV71198.1 hypothetical protein [Ideonella sp.]